MIPFVTDNIGGLLIIVYMIPTIKQPKRGFYVFIQQ